MAVAEMDRQTWAYPILVPGLAEFWKVEQCPATREKEW